MGNSRSKPRPGPKKPTETVVPEPNINPECLFPDWGNKINREFNFVKELGRGGFGMVWKVRRKSDGFEMACKVLNKSKMKQSTLKSTADEVMYYQKLQHPNIISFFGGYETRRKLYILQEMMVGEIDDEIGNLTEAQIQYVISQVIDALEYAHACGVIHSDLKPENIMISNSETMQIKLIDFGLSKSRKRWEWMTKVGGTPAYIAPECLSRRYTEAVDMWALGIITFEMFFGYVPFQKVRGNAIKTISNALKGFEGEVRPGRGNWFPEEHRISENAMTFISYLLKVNPAERLTAPEAKHHPWITNEIKETSHEVSGSSLGFVLQSLLQKRNLNKVQQFLRQVVGSSAKNRMHPFLMRELDKMFKEYDVNNHGYISWEQFHKAMGAVVDKYENITLSSEDVDSFMKSIDTSRTGRVYYDDLISWLTFRHLSAQDDRVWDAVMALDTDANGLVDMGDINRLLKNPDIKDKVSIDTINTVKEKVGKGEGLEYIEFIHLMETNDRSRSVPISRDISRQ